MNVLRILTVDDEVLALRRLRLLLQAMPHAELVGEASSCKEAIECVDRLRPDVVLLDIRMRDGDGFDVLEWIGGRPNPPAVIFVTAFDHYAVRAFERAVVDYLLKPIERDRLAQAISRAHHQMRALEAEQRISEMQELLRNLRSAAAGRSDMPYETEFWLRGASGLVRVPIDAIESASSEDDYVALHTPTGSHLLRGSLRQFEARVEPGQFVRVHRRWIVRRYAIAELRTRRTGGGEVNLTSGKKLPVGRAYLKRLRDSLRSSESRPAPLSPAPVMFLTRAAEPKP
jgi:two-component system LytT family response regulator